MAWNDRGAEHGVWNRSACGVGDNLYVSDPANLDRVDPESGKVIWRRSLPQPIHDQQLLSDGKDLYQIRVISSNGTYANQGDTSITQLDQRDGSPIWSITVKGEPSPLAFGKGIACFYSPVTNEIECLDLETHKLRWVLPNRTPGYVGYSGIPSLFVTDGLEIDMTSDSHVQARSLVDGKLVWERPYPEVNSMSVSSDTVLLRNYEGHWTALSAKAGKVLWRRDGLEAGSVAVSGKLALAATDEGLTVVSLRNGAIVRKTMLPEPIRSLESAPTSHGVIFARAYRHLYGLSSEGKLLWSRPIDFYGSPVYASEHALVLQNFDALEPTPSGGEENDLVPLPKPFALMGFIHGERPAVPSHSMARRKLAEKIIQDYDSLTIEGQSQLRSLGRDAFEPVFFELAKLAPVQNYGRHREVLHLARIIGEFLRPEDTDRVLEVWRNCYDWAAKDRLLAALGEHGDPNKVAPVLISELSPESPSTALEELAASSAPQAVSYMLAKLADPLASKEFREAAYMNLARTGGTEGLKQVLSMRHTSASRSAWDWAAKMGLSELPEKLDQQRNEFGKMTELLDVHTTADGVHYGLFGSAVFGTSGDLFIAKWKEGIGWADPVYTGVDRQGWQFARTDGSAKKDPIEVSWPSTFIGNQELLRDSDHDGIPDLVEKRIGTDPFKADTDGDGIDDLHDRNPLVRPRRLTDDDKVVRAVFEAVTHFQDLKAPSQSPDHLALANVTIKGSRPVELVGFDGVILSTRDTPSELLQGWPRMDGDLGVSIHVWPRTENGDRAVSVICGRGSVYLTNYHYDLTVRRFGQDWLVVSRRMIWEH